MERRIACHVCRFRGGAVYVEKRVKHGQRNDWGVMNTYKSDVRVCK